MDSIAKILLRKTRASDPVAPRGLDVGMAVVAPKKPPARATAGKTTARAPAKKPAATRRR
jgi:hypothetical protein